MPKLNFVIVAHYRIVSLRTDTSTLFLSIIQNTVFYLNVHLYLVPSAVLDPMIGRFVDNLPT